MITSIRGPLVQASPLRVVIELNGLGYEVHIPVTTAERLPGVGQEAYLHTLAVYREDSQTLYGFAAREDRDFFRMMINYVSRVGPKAALSIMSRLSLPLLESAIRDGDVTTLSKCPGIGKKTAERLVIELRNRVGTAAASTPVAPAGGSGGGTEVSSANTVVTDAIAALAVLGYKTAEADKAVRQAMVALDVEATTEQLIKHALGR